MKLSLFICLFFVSTQTYAQQYSWLATPYIGWESIEKQIPPPTGFLRTEVTKNSFGEWLRGLPLFAKNEKVKLYDGKLKTNQNAHFRIVNIDVGKADLQQCADAVMRLRTEFLFAQKRYSDIKFHFTSGHLVTYKNWCNAVQPIVKGNSVTFTKPSKVGYFEGDRKNLMAYLKVIFTYCGTASLSKEVKPQSLFNMKIGDIFIKGGFPGHAVIIVDMVQNAKGEKMFMLAQSYMPAQQIHILKNPADGSAWYSTKISSQLITPEWEFAVNQLSTMD
jgi:Domain of unknown function (4846)